MSVAESKRILIGVPAVYYGTGAQKTEIGEPKTVTFSPEFASSYFKLGRGMGDSKAHRNKIDATVEVEFSTFKIADFNKLVGIAKSNQTLGSVPTVPTSMAFRVQQEVTMTGVAAQTLGEANISNVVVKSLNKETTYTVTTDYTIGATAGTITRVSGGTITAAQVVRVAYDYTDSASSYVQLGNIGRLFHGELNIVQDTEDGNQVQYTIWDAVVDSMSPIVMGETEVTNFKVKFKALHDYTKPSAQALCIVGPRQ